jgi:hypothetical protein
MLKLDRRVLAQFLPNPQAIAAFEQMINAVGDTFPTTIEEAAATAAQAQSIAVGALAMLALLSDELQHMALAPADQPALDATDDALRRHFGTISEQNHDAVQIDGGTASFDAGAEDAPSLRLTDKTTGLYRSAADALAIAIAAAKLVEFSAQLVAVTGSISATQQLKSTVATGTAPLEVASTTRVANLNVASAGQADKLTIPSTFPAPATDLPSVIALANALRIAATNKGL